MSLIDLALLNLRLSLLSFGGGLTILAEMQRELVDVAGVMSAREFATAYALGQATPGPGMLYLIPVGFRAAGAAGAAVALTSYLALPLLLQMVVARQWERFSGNVGIRAVNAVLVPISVGLVGAGLYVLARPLLHEPSAVVGLAAGALASTVLRVSPAAVVLGAGVLGLVGLL